MRDLATIKRENARWVAERGGWLVDRVRPDNWFAKKLSANWENAIYLPSDGEGFFTTEALAWEAAARATEKAMAEARYQDVAQAPRKVSNTYSVIGRYLDNGEVFHDGVVAETPQEAVDKVDWERSYEIDVFGDPIAETRDRDYDIIAVLSGDVVDVTPLKYMDFAR